jgi:rhodanese-related sulfurtransferase
MKFIKPKDLTQNSVILDVRDPDEYRHESLAYPHTFQPLKTLQPEIFIREHHLTGNETINIICTSGGRSSQAAQMFEKTGYDNVAVVIGGMIEADYEGLPIVRH